MKNNNYFPMPNEIFCLGLNSGELAVYTYLMSCEDRETYTPGEFFNSSWLISNGLIKSNELLDIDKKSYCDAHVKAKAYFENPLDHQKNCAVYYQIYLKCMNYEDKGYVAG